MVSLHLVFNYLNAKNDYRLLRTWAIISQEMPAKKRRQALACSKEENRLFWAAERKFNRIWVRTMNGFFVVLCVVFNLGLFLSRYEVNTSTYVIVQAIQVAHNR